MDRKEIKNNFKKDFLELRKIINSWNLIPDSPEDEFDSLNYKILGHLYKNTNVNEIGNILKNYFIVDLGYLDEEINTDIFSYEIMNWWNIK